MDSTQSTQVRQKTMGIFKLLSFYSPIIVPFAVFVYSIFSNTLSKGIYYLFLIFVITCIRIAVMWLGNYSKVFTGECIAGSFYPYSTPTYSTFIMAFTLFYFIMPMILLSQQLKVDLVNYMVVIFFIAFILVDLSIKFSLNCVKIISKDVFGDLIGGISAGIITSVISFYSGLKSQLFVSEFSRPSGRNKDVCQLTGTGSGSHQKFKCNVINNRP